MIRHTRGSPCPVCTGHDTMPRGKEVRCHGYTSDDGKWCFCARIADGSHHEVETTAGPVFAHLLRDEPLDHAPNEHFHDRTTSNDSVSQSHIVAEYNYHDDAGDLAYQVVRLEPKSFRQRQPNSVPGSWSWSTAGVKRWMYDRKRVLESEGVVFLVEGEKDADALSGLGLVATTSSGGAKGWKASVEDGKAVLRGRDVCIIADADEDGASYAEGWRGALEGVAKSVRVVRAPSSAKDASEAIATGATGATAATFLELWRASPTSPWDERWIPVPEAWYSAIPAKRRWLFRDARIEGSPGVFPLGKAGQLVAAGGVGKTMMLISLARAVAAGGRWLGSFDCVEPGAVLLFLGEEDAEEAQRRLYNAAKRDGAAPPNSIVIVPLAGLDCAMLARDAAGNPKETAFLAWARSHIAKRDDWRLIVIDPMSRFAGPDAEKDNAIGTRYVQVLESLATPDRSVLNAHHTPQSARGKGATEAPRGRGVTAAFDGFRWEASLGSEDVDLEDPDDRRRLGELVTLRFTKSNYSRRPEPVQMRRDEFGALLVLDEEDVQIIADARGKGMNRDERREQRAEATRLARRKQDATDDAVASRVRAANHGASVRRLMAIVKAELACGSDRAFNAIQRTTQERDVTL